MNRKVAVTIVAALFVLPLLVWAVSPKADRADDPLKVAPEVYKLVLDEARARVLEVSFEPKTQIAMHSHPDHIAYVIDGGKLEITGADGKPAVFDLTPGMAVWLPAQSHSAKNVGDTKVRLVVFELNEPAPAPSEEVHGKATDK